MSSWQVTMCKRNLQKYQVGNLKSGKNIFYLALCSFSFVTKNIRQVKFNMNLNLILIYSYDIYKPGTNGFYICTEAVSRMSSKKRFSENMQQNYKRTPMPRCDFN